MTTSDHPYRYTISNLFIILLVTLLATIRSGVSAKKCSLGFARKTGVCQPCPPGTFGTSNGPNMCRNCRAGTFNPFWGRSGSEKCANCPPGMYSSKGAATCKKCPPGLYAITGATKCKKCKPGKDLSGSYSSCRECESGYFNDGSSVLCQKCPGGTFANRNAASCKKCPKGTFRDVRHVSDFPVRTCFKCQEGSYADEQGTEQCKLCPPGTSSPKGALNCTSCATGYYRLSPLHKTCRKCPDGSTSLGKRPAGCMHPEKGCPQNTFEVDGECRACSPGERLNVSTMSCVPCGESEVSDGGDVQECVKCRSNRYPAPARTVFEKSACYCKPGYEDDFHGNCVKCNPGSWWDDSPDYLPFTSLRRGYIRYPTSYKQGRCQPCPAMTYSGESGAIECKRCEIGLVSGVGETKCRMCPQWHVPKVILSNERDYQREPFAEARCYSVEHLCRFGEVPNPRICKTSFCPEGTAKWEYGCINCGHAEYLGRNGNICFQCPEGRGNIGRHVKTFCQKCTGKGKLAPGCVCPPSRATVDGACTKCRNGLVAFRGECRTRICDKGMVPDANGNCRRCGRTAIRKNTNDTFCTPCGEGRKSGTDLFFEKNDKCVVM